MKAAQEQRWRIPLSHTPAGKALVQRLSEKKRNAVQPNLQGESWTANQYAALDTKIFH